MGILIPFTTAAGLTLIISTWSSAPAVESATKLPTTVIMPTVTKPTWAAASGKDMYGTWANLQTNGVTQRFRWIQSGTFTMGSQQESAKMGTTQETAAPHQVTLTADFWLADSDCTQALWQKVTGSNPSKFTDSSQNPVEQVSWNDCQQFLSKLNELVPKAGFRLPTEAQWEYACRAGTTTAYSFGSAITSVQVNYNGNFPSGPGPKSQFREKTVPVKSLPPNAWGLYEMHGNVFQWCNDWDGEYTGSAECDPTGPLSGSTRVYRGGGWNSDARNCRSAHRRHQPPDERSSFLGFRLVAPVIP